MASLLTLADFPWFIKPIYGFISDSVPLFGYHRRSYLVLAGFMGTYRNQVVCIARVRYMRAHQTYACSIAHT
jgi:hypothetical protein